MTRRPWFAPAVALAGAAALLLAVTLLTADITRQRARQQHLSLLQTLLPGSTEFTLVPYTGDDGIRSVHQGQTGQVVEVSVQGYVDEVTVLVGVSSEGEVLGLCGVVGSGAEEVCEVLCGDEKPSFGEISVRGRAVRFRSPKQALREGILMIPKERLFEGIVSTLSVEDNIALSNAKQLAKGPFVSAAAVRQQADRWIKDLRIKTSGAKELLMQLSGGNQQKVVFSRALASGADILLLNHPTRGVDVGAKEEIYALIRTMTDEGKAVIVLGDTTDECIGLCSRLIVMKDGLVTGEFEAPADHKPSQLDVVSLMM